MSQPQLDGQIACVRALEHSERKVTLALAPLLVRGAPARLDATATADDDRQLLPRFRVRIVEHPHSFGLLVSDLWIAEITDIETLAPGVLSQGSSRRFAGFGLIQATTTSEGGHRRQRDEQLDRDARIRLQQ